MIIEVAVAVIIDDKNRILITQRSLDVAHPGLWEFPGGKLDPQESPLAALKREVMEEVGLEILDAEEFMQLPYEYPLKSVLLHVYLIRKFNGHAMKRESQMAMLWVSISELSHYAFPEANEIICHKLKTLHNARAIS